MYDTTRTAKAAAVLADALLERERSMMGRDGFRGNLDIGVAVVTVTVSVNEQRSTSKDQDSTNSDCLEV